MNNPEATMGCIDADAYFHTGDVAVIDENERFYIVDRIKELIKYKGFQVPPAELEAIIVSALFCFLKRVKEGLTFKK